LFHARRFISNARQVGFSRIMYLVSVVTPKSWTTS
jgi:hypothetical protein